MSHIINLGPREAHSLSFKDPDDGFDGENIHIYGHGTLSGDKLPHHSASDRPPEDFWKFKSIKIKSQLKNISLSEVKL